MKALTDEQINDIYGFSYVVLTLNPFISKKRLLQENNTLCQKQENVDISSEEIFKRK